MVKMILMVEIRDLLDFVSFLDLYKVLNETCI